MSLFLGEMKEGIQSFDENVVCLGFDLEVIHTYIHRSKHGIWLDTCGGSWSKTCNILKYV